MTEQTKHEHQFKRQGHLDGCHYYSSWGACACGATFSTKHERNPSADPYAAIWMEPLHEQRNRDERGRFIKPEWVEVTCERCEELRKGAKAQSHVVIIAPDGTVELERVEDQPDPEPEPDEDEETE